MHGRAATRRKRGWKGERKGRKEGEESSKKTDDGETSGGKEGVHVETLN